ncbi:Glycosyltransferase, GT2 family [Amycolatopsis arida]|uniref:Glycosyltransferase, GT2 family n=1 Tax=Amycolatopsis arida TaxID=587909 RepID=A0A1I5U0B4_9PSEU|nr:glycosyltransferase [Amycolatopsis arida]TDX95876.1 GT2 family glycosyltransferase [Amycolatopsis arida]SFP88755.1 Glycosyltransferase, GT2 family [Amycolatopsis arida]
MSTDKPGERLIEWTGERCVPWTDDVQVIYEHYHRYAFALRLAEGRRVLDLASGEGYGSAMLATVAERVLGVDIDPESVRHARQRYPLDKLRFDVGSITDPDTLAGEAPFDLITCFEAIEHVAEQDQVMELVTNRLAPGGVFLCSTPDITIYTHEHGNDNQYHVHELREDEFRDLLAARFGHVRLLRQTVAVGSLIHDGGHGGRSEVRTLRRRSADEWTAGDQAPHTYLLGVASDEPVEVPPVSVMLDEGMTMARKAAAEQTRLAEVRQLQDVVHRLEEELRASRERAASATAEAERRVASAAAERDRAVRQARAEQERVIAELARLSGKAEHDTARLRWLSETNADLRRGIDQLATENAKLRAEQSALAQRLVGRYRTTVERVAPRGTRRRDAYEVLMGRQAGVPPAAPETSGPVAVTTSEQPIVSVVIPTYGKWEYTRRCLASIETNLPTTPFEVVVVDDASPDDAADRVARCPGVRLVRAPRNLGFVGACNLGAEHARGELLMFLNNDTEVRPGWLDNLVDTLDTRPDVGLVGAKLVYPDGRLQECGGIIWSDGTGWNYGRGEPADEPHFQTVRDVDYCSGAAILVRREVFDRVGGFDARYAPAYYEDTDLAFAVRAAGMRTLVQPASVVVHHEGVSNGTDTSSGLKRYQEINRATFVAKWARHLADHRPEASERNVWLARHRTRAGHRGGIVLVVDHQVPRTDEDSGSVRMARLLELLVGMDQRVVLFPMNHAVPERYTGWLHQIGVTVVADAGRQLEFLRSAGPELTLAILSRPQVAWQVLEPVRQYAPNCVVAYDTVDLHFVRLGRQADLAADLGDKAEEDSLRRRAEVLREMELGLVRTVDLTLTVSDVERAVLGELVPGAKVEVLSNVHPPLAGLRRPDGRSGVLFVGSFDHLPNRDAATWLATEVMPLVWKRHPEAEAHIVGSNPPAEVQALARDGVRCHGWVPDLAARYRDARVVVAPLRYGAGVKGKVGESLAHGVPVVATSVATEGMHLDDGTDVLVADSAEGLASHIVRLLGDDELWIRLSESGRSAVERQFGPEQARETLRRLLDLCAETAD